MFSPHGASTFRAFAGAVSNRISHFTTIHRLLKTLFLKLPPSLRGPVIVHDALTALSKRQKEVFFVQIGANDGDQNDPLRAFVETKGWKGILVEPVPEYYAALKKNYSGQPGLSFENIAISETREVRPFWYLEDKDGSLPDFARGLGSFFRDEVVSVKVPGVDTRAFLRTIDVPCLSFSDLLEKSGNPVIDLVIIDAQGFDAKIVKQIDFEKLRPSLLVFEHILLDPEECKECLARLVDFGYCVSQDHWDTVAELAV